MPVPDELENVPEAKIIRGKDGLPSVIIPDVTGEMIARLIDAIVQNPDARLVIGHWTFSPVIPTVFCVFCG